MEEYPRGVQQCSEGGSGNEGEVRRCYRGVDRGRRWGGRSRERERERDGGRNKETGMEIDEARGKREWALQRAQAKGRGEVEAGGVW